LPVLVLVRIPLGVIQQQYLGKWDGKLPQIITGGGQGPLLMLPSNFPQERNDKK
jgi:hypothetical protein